MLKMKFLIIISISVLHAVSYAQENGNVLPAWLTLHFQTTAIVQGHPKFNALYSGDNSLSADADKQTSLTATLFFGSKLWKGAELYINPELAGGSGIGGVIGIAGFTNGEIYRIDNPTPEITFARYYLKQTFNFGKLNDTVQDSQNQLSAVQSKHRLTFVAGKFSLSDYFDDNAYSHDSRTQFLNWSIMSSGAWDYAANTKGYTFGLFAEYNRYSWALRAAAVMMPTSANGSEFDTKVNDAFSFNFEVAKSFKVWKKNAVVRLLFYENKGDMGNYALATNDTSYHNSIIATRMYSRTKFGGGINIQLELSKSAGLFARGSYNDGKNETWVFTEIDRSFCLGTLIEGSSWSRNNDNLGISFVINGLSDDHKNYLAAGGYGFLIGDGKLNYAPEFIPEIFYAFRVIDQFTLSVDYQFVLNPAYNKDRGPVHVFAIRSHVEF